jgi:hypothetical protein
MLQIALHGLVGLSYLVAGGIALLVLAAALLFVQQRGAGAHGVQP